mmetsp:Transcript_19912/g.41745  ORF Transcript_19912/g.41745 Transcript_19912/m.41745 type:complete len:141 (-) Transcript_19912:1201-1623(-)
MRQDQRTLMTTGAVFYPVLSMHSTNSDAFRRIRSMALTEERIPPEKAQVYLDEQRLLDPLSNCQKMSSAGSKGHAPRNMPRQAAANEKELEVSKKLMTSILMPQCGETLWTRDKNSVSSTGNLRRQHKIMSNQWRTFPRL